MHLRYTSDMPDLSYSGTGIECFTLSSILLQNDRKYMQNNGWLSMNCYGTFL